MAQLEKDYIRPGKLKYAVREYPLERIHPLAFKASEAALCAADQGKYFEYHDLLFTNQKALAPADLARHAEAAGLEMTAFQSCLDSGKHADRVRSDQVAGQKAGIRSTPTFLVGIQEGDAVRVKYLIRGAHPYLTFKEVIEKTMAGK